MSEMQSPKIVGQYDEKRLRARALDDTSFKKKGIFRRELSYLDRPVITNGTRINGGILIQSDLAEDEEGVFTPAAYGVVVDEEKDPALKDVYSELLDQIRHYLTRDVKNPYLLTAIFHVVSELVNEHMPYSAYLRGKYAEMVKNDGLKKLYLSAFFKGGGVCANQALLASYLVEKLIREGKISGSVSYNHNRNGKNGHAWCRYTSRAGTSFIIDATQNKVGTLDNIQKKAKDQDRLDRLWDYTIIKPESRGEKIFKKLKGAFKRQKATP